MNFFNSDNKTGSFNWQDLDEIEKILNIEGNDSLELESLIEEMIDVINEEKKFNYDAKQLLIKIIKEVNRINDKKE